MMAVKKIVAGILEWGKENPDKEAVIIDDISITYGKLAEHILRAAEWLRMSGVSCGDKVILTAVVQPIYVYLYFALHLIDAVAIPVEKNIAEERLQNIRDIAKPKKVYAGEDLQDCINMNEITLPQKRYAYTRENTLAGDSVSDILFTTGTTGEAKGVMLTHQCIVSGAQNVIEGGKMKQSDRNLLPMPLYHAYGLTTLRAVLFCGATAVLQDGFSAVRRIHLNIHKRKCNCVYLMPSAIPMLEVGTGNNLEMLLGGLDKIEFCTAPLEKQMRTDLMNKLPGVRIYNSYGATEAARTVYMEISEGKLDSIGKAVSNAKIRIVNDDGTELKAGETGRLCISGGMVMKGYFEDRELTKEVLREGRFYTSDIGYCDEDGYLYLLGRSQDIMNIGGEKVAPSEIESIVYELDFVKECVCVAIEDPDLIRGVVPVLFFSTKREEKESVHLIKEKLERQLERFKRPHRIIEIEDIPKNRVGKMDRNRIREMARSECNDRNYS